MQRQRLPRTPQHHTRMEQYACLQVHEIRLQAQSE